MIRECDYEAAFFMAYTAVKLVEEESRYKNYTPIDLVVPLYYKLGARSYDGKFDILNVESEYERLKEVVNRIPLEEFEKHRQNPIYINYIEPAKDLIEPAHHIMTKGGFLVFYDENGNKIPFEKVVKKGSSFEDFEGDWRYSEDVIRYICMLTMVYRETYTRSFEDVYSKILNEEKILKFFEGVTPFYNSQMPNYVVMDLFAFMKREGIEL